MTLVSVKGVMDWGFPSWGVAGIPTLSSILNDAAGEAWAFAFQVPQTGTIDRIIFHTGTVTTAQNMTVTLETVGTDGLPSGSNYGSSTGATWAPVDTDDNKTIEVTLGATASATVGDIVCVRGEWSGTAGSLNINYISGSSATSRGFPKVLPDTGSGFGLTTDGIPMVAVRYNDGTYVVPVGCAPPGTITSINSSSSTSPQEIGFWINAPFAATVIGARTTARTFGTTQTSTLALYTTPSGTPSSQRSTAPTHSQFSVTNDDIVQIFNPYDISASTDYVLGYLQSSTSNLTLYYYDVENANHWGNFAGGSSITYASRNSGGGAFTNTTTRKLIGGVLLSQIHDGTGGGGGGLLTHTGMVGGIRG